jgi:CRP/FNR family transcriptional regulator
MPATRSNKVRTILAGAVPHYDRLATRLTKALEQESQAIEVPAGQVLFDEGTPCRQFLILNSGVIRVSRISPDGRELLLYRVRPGEGCILTIVCLLGHAEYTARGVAETNLRGALIPGPLFEDLVAQVPEFRTRLFGGFANRVTGLVELVADVSFARLDQRLAGALMRMFRDVGGPRLATTHRALAEDVGSVREIVSRLLEGFEVSGFVRLRRGQVEVVDAPGLRALAQGISDA